MFTRIAILAVLYAAAILFWLPCRASGDEPSRPNIVFIMADDILATPASRTAIWST